MPLSASKLKEMLVAPEHIAEKDFDAALQKASASGRSIEDTLIDEGVISDSALGKVIADSYGWQFIDLREERIPEALFHIIPEVAARAQQAVVFDETPHSIKIALTDPTNYEIVKLVEKKSGRSAEIYYATPRSIESALRYYKSDFHQVITRLIAEFGAPGNEEGEDKTIRLVDLFFDHAYQSRASDVHLEPMKDEVLVRFRIDGVLYEICQYPRTLHDRIVSRIKIMSRLRTDEHAVPQDGKFQYKKGEALFDVRVSVVPITTGENIVMRILTEHIRRFPLDEIGLTEDDAEKIRRAIKKPYGMILSAGPTGAGKTTSLYAIIQLLNRTEVNIMTIEDPVEYDIEGVHQIQANQKTGLTFATGLRSIVRQDPDIIFVGEMRDNETADIAVNAALTGHLVLSTIHANNASTVFPRLIDLKIEPFLLASSLNVVISQRLVRKICPHCIRSFFLPPEEVALLAEEPEVVRLTELLGGTEGIERIRFYKGEGCRTCGGAGYLGRTGIFEVLEVTEEMKPLIVRQVSASDIQQRAVQLGMTTLLTDGILKIFRGVTTIAEVIRVTRV